MLKHQIYSDIFVMLFYIIFYDFSWKNISILIKKCGFYVNSFGNPFLSDHMMKKLMFVDKSKCAGCGALDS